MNEYYVITVLTARGTYASSPVLGIDNARDLKNVIERIRKEGGDSETIPNLFGPGWFYVRNSYGIIRICKVEE